MDDDAVPVALDASQIEHAKVDAQAVTGPESSAPSLNTESSDLERQPLLGASKFHQYVAAKPRISKLDTLALFLYLLTVVGVIVITGFTLTHSLPERSSSYLREFRWFLGASGTAAAVVIVLSPLVYVTVSFGFHAHFHIWNFIWLAGAASMVGFGIKFLPLTYVYIAILGGLFALIALVNWYLQWRLRLRTDNLLTAAAEIVSKRKVSVLINLGSVIICTVAIGAHLFLIHQIVIRWTGGLMIFFAIVTGLSLVWNARLVSYIGYMTSCGSYASWYFASAPDGQRIENATWKALARACSSSLGSLSLASFLLSVVWVLQFTLSSVKCCKKISKKLREKVAEYVNIFGIVHMALHGSGFVDAAKASVGIMKDKLMPAHGSLDGMLMVYALGMGLASAALSLLFTGLYYRELDAYGLNYYLYMNLLTLVVFLSTTWIGWTTVQPIHAAFSTVYFCSCEDPAILPVASPEVNDKLGKLFKSAKAAAEKKKAQQEAQKKAAAAKRTGKKVAAKRATARKTATRTQPSSAAAPAPV